MRSQLERYQEETGHLFNLEATPAEGTSFRLARADQERYPEIITAGTDQPYYTNSTQLPVGATDDIFEALITRTACRPSTPAGPSSTASLASGWKTGAAPG